MNRIITVGREFGSGGRELGRRLSEALSFAYYDQEIIEEIAKETSLSAEYVRTIVEKRPFFSYPIHTARTLYPQANPVLDQNMEIYSKQHKIIKALAEKSDCIIVGRCADYILRDMDPFRIFVYADTDSKIKRTREKAAAQAQAAAAGDVQEIKDISKEGSSRLDDDVATINDKELKRRMDRIDKERARYYEFYTGQKWGARENYDLLINTTNISPADAAKNTAMLFQAQAEREEKRA